MPRPNETFIVRVRERNGDAVVEQPRRTRRRRIRDVAGVGDVIRSPRIRRGVYHAFAVRANRGAMRRSDETFIVRVRIREGDAVVEQPRVSRRRRVRDVADAGAVIASWLGPEAGRAKTQPSDDESGLDLGSKTKRRRS